jgi:HAD superfamily 5'-nucleotidase-like hydrolase
LKTWSELFDPNHLQNLRPSPQSALLAHALADEEQPFSRRIFINRTLRMEKIRHIGFDLDWTLADYSHGQMSELAFELTLNRLVERGYPQEILTAKFRSEFCRRGLILDIEEGMVLKMNRHRYVGRAYHGRHFLDGEERSRLYRREPLNPNSKRFHFVDTLFELPEVNVFSEVVEMGRVGKLKSPPFPQLFKDVRQAIDSIHADGTLKERILADLDRYLPRDPGLALALVRMARSGRRLLLITNSEWYYTDGLCRHLFRDALPGLKHWRELFDLVVVNAAKPTFFRRAAPFEELDDRGESVGEVEVPQWNGLYSGGSRENLMRLLRVPGEQVLYVGDHIYGDIVSSKLTSTWRTALVVRELEDELATRGNLISRQRHLLVLRSELAHLGQRMDNLRDVLHLHLDLGVPEALEEPLVAHIEEYLEELRLEHKAMRQHAARLQARISKALNPYWGSLFKQGSNKSLFGSQVNDFACVYTSRVSNFGFYGSDHYFRVMLDPMMHEAEI